MQAYKNTMHPVYSFYAHKKQEILSTLLKIYEPEK